jgi:hypothetical protein
MNNGLMDGHFYFVKCSCVRLASTTRCPARTVGNYEMPVQHGLLLVRMRYSIGTDRNYVYNFSPCQQDALLY